MQLKSYTDIKQSKKLAEILPIESADMRYGYIAPYDYSDRMFDGGYDEVPYPKDFLKRNPNFSENEYDGEFPCWSLSALLDVLKYSSLNQDVENKWSITYWTGAYPKSEYFFDNPVDACYEMIIRLNELKML